MQRIRVLEKKVCWEGGRKWVMSSHDKATISFDIAHMFSLSTHQMTKLGRSVSLPLAFFSTGPFRATLSGSVVTQARVAEVDVWSVEKVAHFPVTLINWWEWWWWWWCLFFWDVVTNSSCSFTFNSLLGKKTMQFVFCPTSFDSLHTGLNYRNIYYTLINLSKPYTSIHIEPVYLQTREPFTKQHTDFQCVDII